MLKEYKSKTIFFIIAGIVLYSLPIGMVEDGELSSDSTMHSLAIIISFIFLCLGCMNWAIGKGYPRAWGLLGLLHIFGLIILAFFPDKNKSDAVISYSNQSETDHSLSPGEAKMEILLNSETERKSARKRPSLNTRDIIKSIEKLTDQNILAKIALEDEDQRCRKAAVEKLKDQNIIFDIAINDEEFSIRKAAVKVLSNQNFIDKFISESNSSELREAAINKLKDQNIIYKIAINAEESDSIRKKAINKLNNQSRLVEIAESKENYKIRGEAIKKLKDQTSLERIVENDKSSKIRVAAVKKITDQSFLSQIVQKSDSSAVRNAALDQLDNFSTPQKLSPSEKELVETELHDVITNMCANPGRSYSEEEHAEPLYKLLPKSNITKDVAKLFVKITTFTAAFTGIRMDQSMGALRKLCKLKGKIIDNLLHCIADMSDTEQTITTMVFGSGSNNKTSKVSFEEQRNMAQTELKKRGSPEYNPKFYLDK